MLYPHAFFDDAYILMYTVPTPSFVNALHKKPTPLHYTLGGVVMLFLAIIVFIGFRNAGIGLISKNNGAALAPATVSSPHTLGLKGILPSIFLTNDVKIVGNYAYVATNKFGLSVVDISNPAAPFVVSSSIEPFNGTNVAISGNIAAVNGDRKTKRDNAEFNTYVMYFFDITDPLRPRIIGKIENKAYNFNDIAISGDRLYVTVLSKLYVVDINKVRNFRPTVDQPTIAFVDDDGFGNTTVRPDGAVTGFYSGSSAPKSMTINGHYLYLAGDNSLRTFDIANAALDLKSTLNVTNGTGFTFISRGSGSTGYQMAYFSHDKYIDILDMDNPAQPIIKQTITVNDPASLNIVTMYQVGDTLFLINSNFRISFLSYDITDRFNPVKKAQFSILTPPAGFDTSSIYNMAIVNNVAYVASYGAGLVIFSGADSASPTRIATVMERFTGIAVDSKPGYAAIVGSKYSGNAGLTYIQSLRIINTEDPSRPFIAGELTYNASFKDVALSGNYAYIAGTTEGLYVVDLSAIPARQVLGHPTALSITSTKDTPGFASSVTVFGNYIYVGDGFGGLAIFDIGQSGSPGTLGTPSNPNFLGSFKPAIGNYAKVEVVGSTLYTGLSSGINSFNITNITNPTFVKSYSLVAGATAYEARDMKVEGSIAYVASARNGILAVDLSSRKPGDLPNIIGALTPWGGREASAQAMVKDGINLYTANYDGGIVRTLIRSGDPTNVLYHSSSVATVDTTSDLALDLTDSHYVYAADAFAGFVIADFPDVAPPTPLYHPADISRDFYVDATENLNYASCWKNNCTTANSPVPIPNNYLLRGTLLLKRTGGLYHYVSITDYCTPTNAGCWLP